MDKVEEGDSSAKKSFLLGWPMENFRATFHSLEQKEKWYSFLERNIKLTKEKDNQKSLELQIFAKDFHPCPIDVTATSFDTVNDIIKKILSILGITGCENEYLLSFNSGNEEAPFSLNGHECPYAIKMNQLGEKAFIPQRPSKFTSQTFQEPILGQVSLDLKGQFFLKPRHPSKETATDKEISNARSGIGDFAADLDPTTTTWMNSHLPQGQDYALEFLLWIYVIMTAHHLQFWGKELVVTYYCLIFMLPGKEIVFMA
ncbi:rho GTPase-activating protein 20-like [Castor canadensis]|uniref:Rho GTPase-activating protein 20-like n=6 Tax=Castor canadensis TaxID=51338 RepID=A0AC58JYK7_CASCN